SGGSKGSGSGGSGSGGSGSGGSKGSGSGGSGSGGSKGTGGSGNDKASTTKAYHNGGVEGDGYSEWYDANMAEEFKTEDSVPESFVLDLSDAGAAFVLNVTTSEDGTQMGSVEFQDADGNPVAWGHFGNVSEIILPDDPTSYFYTESDFEFIGEHGEGKPPEVSLDAYLSVAEEGDETGGTKGSGTAGSGTGGSKGSGSGGSKGSGSGGSGSGGSGSGGSKGSGSGGSGSGGSGSGGSGSGGSKGSGSGGSGSGSGGSGSGGSKGSGSGGSGSGGSKGSGTGGSKGTEDWAAASGLPAFTPDPTDYPDMSEDAVMKMMTQGADDQETPEDETPDDWDDSDIMV
ncbi:hypothetical protein, partial [Marinovum algicola]